MLIAKYRIIRNIKKFVRINQLALKWKWNKLKNFRLELSSHKRKWNKNYKFEIIIIIV